MKEKPCETDRSQFVLAASPELRGMTITAPIEDIKVKI